MYTNKPLRENSTPNPDCKESVFNVLFLVLDFPLGTPYTLLKQVIERSILGIVVGEGSWWDLRFSIGDFVLVHLMFGNSISCSVACFKRLLLSRHILTAHYNKNKNHRGYVSRKKKRVYRGGGWGNPQISYTLYIYGA